jgi:hypothetical protein
MIKKTLKPLFICLVVISVTFCFSACGFRAHKRKNIEKELKQQPVNCSTAEGDIRVLKGEKAHVAEQIAMGASAIIPIGLVVGVLTGTEVEKVKIAIGEYDKKIDKKIVEIKQECNIE